MSPAARRLRLAVLGAFAALAISVLWSGARRPAVLVVHSQSERIAWTRGIDAGIDEVLNRQGGVRLQRIYQNGQDTGHAARQDDQVRGFIARWRPGAVITVNDLAQTVVTRHYTGQATSYGVYAGMDKEAHAQSPATHVSAGAERTPWAVVEDMLVSLVRPQDRAGSTSAARSLRVALINDGGAVSAEQAHGFAAYRWTKATPIGAWRCETRAQWIQALQHIAQHADVVLIGDYRAMPVPAGVRSAAWLWSLSEQALEHLPQPIMALSAYAVEDGVPLAVLPSPMEQGEVAARQALRTLDAGAQPPAPHAHTMDFALLVNTEAMAARQLSLGALDAYYARLSQRVMGAGNW